MGDLGCISYDEFRAILERLEETSQPAELSLDVQAFVRSPTSVTGEFRSREQFFAVDRQRNTPVALQPIVVAVGMNYTQGDEPVPRDLGRPVVEDSLRTCRNNAVKMFAHFGQNRVRWRDAGCVSDHNMPIPGPSFHFAMTNLCPWITTQRWQELPPRARAVLHRQGSIPEHLRQLAGVIQNLDVVWIAHGRHAEIFDEWPALAAKLGITRWYRTANLSFFYNYDKWPMLNGLGL